MGTCCWDQARASAYITILVDPKKINGVLVVESIDLQRDWSFNLSPIPLADVNLVPELKITLKIGLVDLTVRPIDDVDFEHDDERIAVPAAVLHTEFLGLSRANVAAAHCLHYRVHCVDGVQFVTDISEVALYGES
jgi:hypothetical protein